MPFPQTGDSPIGIRGTFAAPGFTWLWLYMTSGAVTWTIESITHGWLVLQLTDSPLWVGAVAGARGVAQFTFSIPGGAIGDRADRGLILLVTQSVLAAATGLVAMLALGGQVQAWHVLLLAAVGGMLASVDKPAAGSLLVDIVGEGRLLNANALRFVGSSVIRIIGAVAGGYVLAKLGAGQNYLLATGVHVAGLACLVPLRGQVRKQHRNGSYLQAVREGLRYTLRAPAVRRLLLLSLVTESFGFSYNTMLPVIARDVLRVGALGLGYLSAASGLGQLAVAAGVAGRANEHSRGRLMALGGFAFGVCIVLFGLSPWFAMSLILVCAVGAASSLYDPAMTTVMIAIVDPAMRSRVLGFYFMTIGVNHLGSLAVGYAATLIGAPLAVAAGGAIVAMSALALVRDGRAYESLDA